MDVKYILKNKVESFLEENDWKIESIFKIGLVINDQDYKKLFQFEVVDHNKHIKYDSYESQTAEYYIIFKYIDKYIKVSYLEYSYSDLELNNIEFVEPEQKTIIQWNKI